MELTKKDVRNISGFLDDIKDNTGHSYVSKGYSLRVISKDLIELGRPDGTFTFAKCYNYSNLTVDDITNIGRTGWEEVKDVAK